MHLRRARVPPATPVGGASPPLRVLLQLRVGGAVAAEQSLSVAGTGWRQFNSTVLTPNASSSCGATAAQYPGLMGPNATQCSGTFALLLVSPGSVDVDMVTLRPAPNRFVAHHMHI